MNGRHSGSPSKDVRGTAAGRPIVTVLTDVLRAFALAALAVVALVVVSAGPHGAAHAAKDNDAPIVENQAEPTEAPAGATSKSDADDDAIVPDAADEDAMDDAAPDDGDARGRILPGLLLGLLLGLAALHLARQVYSDAPGSLSASGLLVAAFMFEYVAFGLHQPFVGTGRVSAIVEAVANAGLALAALSFLSGYLGFAGRGGLWQWVTRSLMGVSGFVILLAPFDTHQLAYWIGASALASVAVFAFVASILIGRRGESVAHYLTPGLAVILVAVVVGGAVRFGLLADVAGIAAHGLFVIGLLLVAFAVESVEVPPQRSYLALPPPSPEAPALIADTGPSAVDEAEDTTPPGEPPPVITTPPPTPEPTVPVAPAPHGPPLTLAPVSERRLALALAAAGHGLWDWSIQSDRLALSPESEALIGIGRDFEGTFEGFAACLAEEDRARVHDALLAHAREGETTFTLSFHVITKGEESRPLVLDGACLNLDAEGHATRIIGLVSPASAVNVLAMPAPPAAPPAPLGRRALIEALETHLAQCQERSLAPGMLLVTDLDRFHAINDGFGHSAGDHVLEVVAERLEGTLKDNERLMRLGGDEFALVLGDVPGDPLASARADEIMAALGRPIALAGGGEAYVSASMGLVPLEGEPSGEAALKDAETALHYIKRGGGGRHGVFSDDMRERMRTSASLEADLRRALEQEEIELHYQPIMALADNSISGFEALIRWRHPERGVLAPDAFVELAEETGLIVPLGKYALAMASVQLYQWQTFFPLSKPLFACVNVSSRQLLRNDLVRDVREVLSAVSLAPNSLRLEVTEQLLAQDVDQARSVLEQIKTMGAGISLDDFGTGYASIGKLQGLPIDTLKVDKSFIARLRNSDEASVITRTIIDLAHGLNMDVIAEGVENEDDMNRLREMGCEFGQGYYFGMPMLPVDAQTFIAEHWAN